MQENKVFMIFVRNTMQQGNVSAIFRNFQEIVTNN
jgi:hypothetical protein